MRREYDKARKAWLYRLHWRDGRRTFSRVRYFRTDADALAYVQSESGREDAGLSWDDLVKRWSQAHLSCSASYLAKVARTVKELQEGGLPSRVSAADRASVARWLATRTPAKAGHDLRHLRAVGRWACQQGFLDSVPFAAVKAPKHHPKKRVRVRLADIPGLLARLPEELLPPVLWVCLTGCRSGEACALCDKDIGQDQVVLQAKGRHQPAYLLDSSLRAVLALGARWKAKRPCRTSAAFVTRLGHAWTPTAMSHAIKEAWPPGVTLHCIRHAWGTEAGRRRYGADMVQAVLGHRSRASAIPYVHLTEDADAREDGAAPIRSTIVAHIAASPTLNGLLPPPPTANVSGVSEACPHCGKPIDVKQLSQNASGTK